MAKISFKLDEVTNHTTIRISKNSYPYNFIKFLGSKSDFDYCRTNKMNHVFIYKGDVGNAEFYFKAHLATYNNLNNRSKI